MSDNPTEAFEKRANAFYKATGVMAPGKDDPFIHDVYDLKVKLYAEWRVKHLLLSAIRDIKSAASMSDECNLPMLEDLSNAIDQAAKLLEQDHD